jgi:hypothetical protein
MNLKRIRLNPWADRADWGIRIKDMELLNDKAEMQTKGKYHQSPYCTTSLSCLYEI